MLIAFLVVFFIAVFFIKTNALEAFQLSLFAAFSALIPDIDHEMGKARKIANKIIPLMVFFIILINTCGNDFLCISNFSHLKTLVIISLAVIGLYFILFTYLMPRHRGIIHSLSACIIFSVLTLFILNEKLAFAGFIGYLSHLIVDREIKFV